MNGTRSAVAGREPGGRAVVMLTGKTNNSPPCAAPIVRTSKSQGALSAEIAYDPAARSLAGARGFIKGTMGEQALTESLEALNVQVKEVRSGNLGGAEKTLVAQANALDAIFNELSRRAALNMGEYLNATDIYLRLALKAAMAVPGDPTTQTSINYSLCLVGEKCGLSLLS